MKESDSLERQTLDYLKRGLAGPLSYWFGWCFGSMGQYGMF